MSFGYITELVTPTGEYRHLRAPWSNATALTAACPAHGDFTALEYDFDTRQMQTDSRPVCPGCIERWRRWVAWCTENATERLDELEHVTAAAP